MGKCERFLVYGGKISWEYVSNQGDASGIPYGYLKCVFSLSLSPSPEWNTKHGALVRHISLSMQQDIHLHGRYKYSGVNSVAQFVM